MVNSYLKFEKLLKQLNISTHRISKEIDYAESNFTSWKNSNHTPSLKTMTKIADYFCIDVQYFLDDNIEYLEDVDLISKYSLNKDEITFLKEFRQVNKKQQDKLLDLLKVMKK